MSGRMSGFALRRLVPWPRGRGSRAGSELGSGPQAAGPGGAIGTRAPPRRLWVACLPACRLVLLQAGLCLW